MRDLHKTLEFCSIEDSMDYCEEFDGIKSTLEYCDKHIKPFKKLVFRSGNESIVNELTRRLQALFEEHQLIDPDEKIPYPKAHQKLRKILMFLFANTDATYKFNLRDDPKYVHVVEICPLLPKFLTVALIWELQLDTFFFEALTFTPYWFHFSFIEAANESLKYIDDAYKVLSTIEQLLKALLISIERSTKLQMDAVEQKIIYNKLYDQAAILLRRFNTPDTHTIEKMKKKALHHYCGHKLKHLLEIVLFAFDLYESKFEISPNFDISVYSIGEIFHKINSQNTNTTICSRAAKDEILRITNALLGTLQSCVMSVNMYSFIEWAEVDITPSMTLQQTVGFSAFNVRERIDSNASFEHSVGEMLRSIEIRPRPLTEIISESSIGQILRNLYKSPDMPYATKRLWFDELFNRENATLENEECLQFIEDNLYMITVKNCEKIMDLLKLKDNYDKLIESDTDNNFESDADDDFEDSENINLRKILFKALKQFDDANLLELLLYQEKNFGALNHGIVISDTADDFPQRATAFLNKCTTVFYLQEFLLLCFEHPQQMWTKFFNSACSSSEHLRHFSETVQKTLPHSHKYVDEILKEAVMYPTHMVYFPELFYDMYFILYRAEHKVDFLAKFINEFIKTSLDAEDFDSLLPIIKGLDLIARHNDTLNFEELTSPMLVTMAMVADLARWNLDTYSDVRVKLVNLCISFISNTLNRFSSVANDKDRKWLSTKIKSTCTPLTQFYFQSVLCENILPLDCFLCCESNLNRPQSIKFLNKILVCCNSDEFQAFAKSARFSSCFGEAIHQLTVTINRDPDPKAVSNLHHCLAEYMNAVNDLFKPKCSNGKEIYELLLSVLNLISVVPNEIYDQLFMETECLLKDLFSSPKEKFSVDEMTKLLNFVQKMSDCPAKNIFLKTLNDSISSN